MGREISDEAGLEAIVRAMTSVAVVGMKDESRAGEPAFAIPAQLQRRGVRVFAVNPTIQQALGQPAYPSVAAVPERVDVVNVFRRSEVVEALADEIIALPAARRPAVVWMQSGIHNQAAADKLTAAGMDVVMDQCLGVYASRYRR